MTITEPGIYSMPATDYHADPAPAPSLSASLAQTLVSRSPRHAWHECPTLNLDREPEEVTAQAEEGTALHALLLERQEVVEKVGAMDWRTKAAQEARRGARERGRVAILAHRWNELLGTAMALRVALSKHEIGDFLARPGRPEQVMAWQEETPAGDIWCRARVDWLCDDMPVLVDLKTTEGSASPDVWGRSPAGKEAPLRAAHYLRGARALGIARPRYLFCIMERDPPFGVSVCELSPALLQIGEEQHEFARNMWGACLKDCDWPSYPPMVATLEASNGAVYGHEDWKQRVQQMRTRKPKPFAGQASELIGRQVMQGREIWG